MRQSLRLIALLLYFMMTFLLVTTAGCHGKDDAEPNISDTVGSGLPNIVFVFTDDQGYADIGANGQVSDIRTPHIDSLAQDGVRMTNGYVTAPQCAPSRAALMTGMYQQRFGVDENDQTPLPADVPTVAEYFRNAGYRTGIFGKWNLDVSAISDEWNEANLSDSIRSTPGAAHELKLPYYSFSRGFDECLEGYTTDFWTNFDDNGKETAPRLIQTAEDRIGFVNRSAVNFIERNAKRPFFLYVAPYAPHVPLIAATEYLDRFPADMPQRRRYALAMMAAIDDGIGRIVATLRKHNLYENTLLFFMSDNGAPLGLDKPDVDVTDDSGIWDGSENTPMVGEKGMLTEGGIRIPFVAHWPGHLPAGKVLEEPVSSLDAMFTALKSAGVPQAILNQLDGLDLIPAMRDNGASLNSRPLFWRFHQQAAVRLGDWKYLRTSETTEYLFDLSLPELSSNNQMEANPDKAMELKQLLSDWEATLRRPSASRPTEPGNYQYHLKPAAP